MITLDTIIVVLVVLASAIMTGRWLWRSLHPPQGAPPCSGCSSAGDACSTCTLVKHGDKPTRQVKR